MDNEFTPTNIFANTTFDILQVDVPEDPLININKLSMTDLEESFLNKGINFINEMNNSITASKIILYESISKSSGDTIAIVESFSDFYTSAVAIIEKFIKCIKETTANFIANLKHRVSQTILNDNFVNSKSDDSFTINGFEYSFDQDIPSSQFVKNTNYNLFNDYIGGNNLTTDSANTTKFDEFRASILKLADNECTSYKFGDECFKVYRSGRTDSYDINITKQDAKDALERYKDVAKLEKDLNSQVRDIEKVYDEILKQIKNITKCNGNLNPQSVICQFPNGSNVKSINNTIDITGMNNASDVMYMIDVFVKQRLEELIEYTNIHMIAFSAKLDALRDRFMQDENIINTANRIWIEEEVE